MAKPDKPTRRTAGRRAPSGEEEKPGLSGRVPGVTSGAMSNILTPADIEYLLMLSPAKRVEALVSGAISAARRLDASCGEACEPWEIEKVILEAVRMHMALVDEGCPPQRM